MEALWACGIGWGNRDGDIESLGATLCAPTPSPRVLRPLRPPEGLSAGSLGRQGQGQQAHAVIQLQRLNFDKHLRALIDDLASSTAACAAALIFVVAAWWINARFSLLLGACRS